MGSPKMIMARVRRLPDKPRITSFGVPCCQYTFDHDTDEFVVKGEHFDWVAVMGNMELVEFIELGLDEGEEKAAVAKTESDVTE